MVSLLSDKQLLAHRKREAERRKRCAHQAALHEAKEAEKAEKATKAALEASKRYIAEEDATEKGHLSPHHRDPDKEESHKTIPAAAAQEEPQREVRERRPRASFLHPPPRQPANLERALVRRLQLTALVAHHRRINSASKLNVHVRIPPRSRSRATRTKEEN